MQTYRSIAGAIAIFLAATAIVFSSFDLSGSEFLYPDAKYYAEMGRQLERGEGFTSLQAYPYLLKWLRDRDLSLEPPWPNVSRFPLLTILNAGAFAIVGPSDAAVRAVGGAFFALTAAAVFLLGARLFGVAIGCCAAAVHLSDRGQRFWALQGLPDTPASFFLVAAALSLAAALSARKRSWLPALLLGVVIGLSFLLRYDLLVLAPAAACALGVGRGPEGRRQLAWAALGTILAAAPWLLRNWIYFGAPHVLLSIERNLFMRPFVDPYVSTAQLDVWDALRDADFVMAKLARFTWPFKRWSVFLGWHSPWIGPVFLAAGLVFLMRRHPAGRIWLFVMVAFLLRTLLLSIMHHELRFYVSFGAVVNVLAVGGLAVALEALSGRRWVPAGVAATAAIALLLPALYSAATASPPPATPPQMHRLRAEAAALESRSKRGSVIATRWGAPMAWYANRPTIDVLPSQVGTLVRLGARIDGLFYPKEDAERVGALLRGQRISERYALIPNVDGSGALWLTRRAIRRGVLRSSSMKGEAPATKAGPGMGVLDAP